MKKLLSSLFTMLLVSTTATSVAACSTPNTLIVTFVGTGPDPIQLQNVVAPFAEKLETQLKIEAEKDGRTFSKEVEVKLVTDANTAGTSLAAGTSDVAFLATEVYRAKRGEPQSNGTYSDLGVLVSASRHAPIPETTFEAFKDDSGIFDPSIPQNNPMELATGLEFTKNYNEFYNEQYSKHGDDDDYNYLTSTVSTNSSEDVAYFRSFGYATNEIYDRVFDAGDDGNLTPEEYKNNLHDVLLDQNVKVAMSTRKTSASGLVYPFAWFLENGILDENELLQLWNNKANLTSSNLSLLDDQYDIEFGFSDIRMIYNTKDGQQNQLLDETKAIFATSPIANDGVSYSRKSLTDPEELEDIRQAFIYLNQQPENREIFDLNQHASYSDIDGIEGEAEYDKWVDEMAVDADEIIDLMKAWT